MGRQDGVSPKDRVAASVLVSESPPPVNGSEGSTFLPPAFVKSHVKNSRFQLAWRGRRCHLPSGALTLRLLTAHTCSRCHGAALVAGGGWRAEPTLLPRPQETGQTALLPQGGAGLTQAPWLCSGPGASFSLRLLLPWFLCLLLRMSELMPRALSMAHVTMGSAIDEDSRRRATLSQI